MIDIINHIIMALKDDAIKPLNTGCNKFTKLSRLISLCKLKGKHGHLDVSFKELQTLLSELFIEYNVLPSLMNEVKKMLH